MHRVGQHVKQQLVGYLALFVALGGVSYAAVRLPVNSVGSRQIARSGVKSSDLAADAVSSPKVKNGSLLASDFRAGQLPSGPKGQAGAKGEAGARGESCSPTDPACRGPKGDAGSLIAVLGRGAVGGVCDADTPPAYEACATANLTLPQAGRVLLVSAGNWYENGSGGNGDCVLTIDGGVLAGPIAHTGGAASGPNTAFQWSLTGVSAPLAVGDHAFTASCRRYSPSMAIHWSQVQLSAVLLGAG